MQVNEGVQILHVANCHWVMVKLSVGSGLRCYDSLRKRGVHKSVIEQCHQLWQGQPVTRGKAQQQSNGDDCGVFAIAFAEAACRGLDGEALAALRFDDLRMREHLVACFKAMPPCITPFPTLA